MKKQCIFYLDSDIHIAFDRACTSEGYKMSHIVSMLLEQYATDKGFAPIVLTRQAHEQQAVKQKKTDDFNDFLAFQLKEHQKQRDTPQEHKKILPKNR